MFLNLTLSLDYKIIEYFREKILGGGAELDSKTLKRCLKNIIYIFVKFWDAFKSTGPYSYPYEIKLWIILEKLLEGSEFCFRCCIL